jgi:hypothetical protein
MALSLISFETVFHHIPDPSAERPILIIWWARPFHVRTLMRELGTPVAFSCFGNRTLQDSRILDDDFAIHDRDTLA